MSAVHATAEATLPDSRPAHRRRRYLYNRWMDFLLLGGGSWLVLGGLAAFYPRDGEAPAALAAATLFLAHFVNHPHFAHSYQVFYSGFVRKAFSEPSALRSRYRFAGIMVPAILTAFFATTLLQGNAAMLGLAANAMFLTVGWHYAKQGFGILMLDAAHNGTGFTGTERRNLLWNTHLTWVTYWLMTNDVLSKKYYWGLTYFTFDTPDPLLWAMAALTAVSLCVVARDFLRKWRQDRSLPANGLIAYVTAVYVWLMLAQVEPIVHFVAPAFHSLQYLAVVWRRQLNVETERAGQRAALGRGRMRWLRKAPARLLRFGAVGGLLGAAGVWWVPEFLNEHAPFDAGLFGATVFLFIGWTFINIHHYFIDAVIWRRENADTRRYLFEGGPAAGRPPTTASET